MGAFPREGVKRDAGSEVLARSYDGLQRLVTETGLNIRGMIVYLGVTRGNVDEFRSGRRPHYLVDADIKTLTDLVPVSYTHPRAHVTVLALVCRLLLEEKKKTNNKQP